MRTGFFGRGYLGLEVLKGILDDKRYEVPLIISCSATPEVKYNEEDFKKIAIKYGARFIKTNNLNAKNIINIVNEEKIELGVAMLWLYTLSKEIISTAPRGFINLHGGMLPKYRGNACSNWAILNRESHIGVTCHYMDPDSLDSGDIILQESLEVREDECVGSLSSRFEDVGIRIVLEAINKIKNGIEERIQQDEKKASYCFPRIPEDGYIDWSANDVEIMRLIRSANRPYPGAYTYFKHYKTGEIKKMSIYKVSQSDCGYENFYCEPGHIVKLDGNKARGVCCGNGVILRLDDIEIDGNNIKAEEYFKTVRQRLGILVEDWLYEMASSIEKLKGEMKN